MEQHRQLAKNTLILAIGKSAGSMASFLLLPLYTIFLTPNQYGFFDLISTYIVLFIPIMTLQMEMTLFRFLIDARNDHSEKKRLISNSLQILFVTIIILIILYTTIASLLKIPYMWLILFNVITSIFANLLLQIARGFGENKVYATANIIAGVTLLFTSLVFIISMRLGVNGIFLASSVVNIVIGLYLFQKLKLHRYINFFQHDNNLIKQLLSYSLPLIPNGVSWWIVTVSDRTIVTIFLGLTANGIYAVSNRFASIFLAFYAIFEMSWAESSSVHINAKNRDSFFSDVANMVVRGFGSIGLLIVAGLPIIFPIIIGHQFGEALNYAPILILAVLYNSIAGFYGAIYVAKKMTKQVMATSIASAVINIGLNLVLINFIGIYAAALSTAVAYLAMVIYRHYDLKKFIKISYEKGLFVKLFIAYAVVITLYYYNNQIFNIANIFLALGIVFLLNKSILGVAAGMFRNKIVVKR